jgi:hypothetical protein
MSLTLLDHRHLQVGSMLTTIAGQVEQVNDAVNGINGRVDALCLAGPQSPTTGPANGTIDGGHINRGRNPLTQPLHEQVVTQQQQRPLFDVKTLNLGRTTLSTLFAAFFHMAVYEQVYDKHTNPISQQIRDQLGVVKKLMFYMKLYLPINTTIPTRVSVSSGAYAEFCHQIVALGEEAASNIDTALDSVGETLYCWKAIKALQERDRRLLPRLTFIDNNLPQYSKFWRATTLAQIRKNRKTKI